MGPQQPRHILSGNRIPGGGNQKLHLNRFNGSWLDGHRLGGSDEINPTVREPALITFQNRLHAYYPHRFFSNRNKIRHRVFQGGTTWTGQDMTRDTTDSYGAAVMGNRLYIARKGGYATATHTTRRCIS
ncbi:hypothetical protein ACQKM2_01680 [Streptomyces sp. NPDC004126]|uniref:hypothetical protein n=1 Tax=Streptomyces sp. NPDC004126 TaxID=3390695 RepID=UPI003D015C8D